MGQLCADELSTNQQQALAEARATSHMPISLPSGPESNPNLPVAIVISRTKTQIVPDDENDLLPIEPFHDQPPLGWPQGFLQDDP